MRPSEPVSFLLDTFVVKELRKSEQRANPRAREWAARCVTQDFFVSVITIKELEIGVAGIERHNAPHGHQLRS